MHALICISWHCDVLKQSNKKTRNLHLSFTNAWGCGCFICLYFFCKTFWHVREQRIRLVNQNPRTKNKISLEEPHTCHLCWLNVSKKKYHFVVQHIQPQLHDNNNRVKPPLPNTELPNPLERARNPFLGKRTPRGSHRASCLVAGSRHRKIHGPWRKGHGARWTPDKRSCHRLPPVIAPGVWLTDGQKKR